MYGQERIKPYGKDGDKREQVEEMFDNIAPTYDKLNHRLSWNIDKRWRRRAVDELKQYDPATILDVATGTGDFALQLAETLHPQEVVGADISEGMMAIGRQKVSAAGLDEIIRFQKEDCFQMSFPDGSFDAVTAAFGIRNFSDLDGGLCEMCRVLKPGGHLSVVELTTPRSFPMRQLFWLYSHTILPIYGKLVSKDKSAYRYLTATMEAFPQGEQMVGILKKAGFSEACFHRLTFGICTHYFATK
ncbi:MAG: bifunctional demethylmenaquinone methyltransferase/2-methoxy-6-polyprenyl-1,4-benzoquinol methylase UbiE [Prevotella sp.]|nr:bifunctional demethylmenaquinone methyltransferase/2-methoxy-6-polyprenyl-1,4-benzoquinol methylase UbiE [Prevotella sp.]